MLKNLLASWISNPPGQLGAPIDVTVPPDWSTPKLLDELILATEQLKNALAQSGLLILRNAKIDNSQKLQTISRLIEPMCGSYVGGAAPRGELLKNVYESTKLPQQLELGLHQEMAYLPNYPRVLMFACCEEAQSGGQTSFVHLGQAFRTIDPKKIDTIFRRGLRYTRNLASASNAISFLHRPWREVLQVKSKNDAELTCSKLGVTYEWGEDESLNLTHSAPGFAYHPVLERDVWFNQLLAQNANKRSFGAMYPMLLRHRRKTAWPHDVTFGDGEPISEEFLHDLYDAQEKYTYLYSWSRGDLLLIDNLIVAHGRKPYTGPRKILVALGAWPSI